MIAPVIITRCCCCCCCCCCGFFFLLSYVALFRWRSCSSVGALPFGISSRNSLAGPNFVALSERDIPLHQVRVAFGHSYCQLRLKLAGSELRLKLAGSELRLKLASA